MKKLARPVLGLDASVSTQSGDGAMSTMHEWLYYTSDEDPAAQLLESGLASLVGPDGLDRLHRPEELASLLREAASSPEFAFLVLTRREEFELLTLHRERLAGWRLVLALGRAVGDLSASAHRLRPRFLANWPEELPSLLAVALKAAQVESGPAQGGKCLPRLVSAAVSQGLAR